MCTRIFITIIFIIMLIITLYRKLENKIKEILNHQLCLVTYIDFIQDILSLTSHNLKMIYRNYKCLILTFILLNLQLLPLIYNVSGFYNMLSKTIQTGHRNFYFLCFQ